MVELSEQAQTLLHERGRYVCPACHCSFLAWPACYDHMAEEGHADLHGVSRSAGSGSGCERFLAGTHAKAHKVVLLESQGDARVGERLRVVGQTKGSWVVERLVGAPRLELRKSWAADVAPVAGRRPVYRWLDPDLTDDEDDSSPVGGEMWVPPAHAHLPPTEHIGSHVARVRQRCRSRRPAQGEGPRRSRSRSRSPRRAAAGPARSLTSYDDIS